MIRKRLRRWATRYKWFNKPYWKVRRWYEHWIDSGKTAMPGVPYRHWSVIMSMLGGQLCPRCRGADVVANGVNHYFFCITCGERWVVPYIVEQGVHAINCGEVEVRPEEQPTTAKLFERMRESERRMPIDGGECFHIGDAETPEQVLAQHSTKLVTHQPDDECDIEGPHPEKDCGDHGSPII